MKMYFVRHGQTYLNKYKKMQGWSDTPLTPEGEQSASQTGERLKEVPFHTVYTSDLGRTLQTAKLILAQNTMSTSVKIHAIKELRETFFGSFEAVLGEEVYPKVAEKHGIELKEVFGKLSLAEIADTMKALDPYHDAESATEFNERLEKALEEILANCCEGTDHNCLVVTHGNVIRHLVRSISPKTNIFQEIGNSSITIIEYKENKLRLQTFNE